MKPKPRPSCFEYWTREAAVFEHRAEKAEAAGRRRWAERYRERAQECRQQAGGFDYHGESKDYWHAVKRCSVLLNAEAVDVLAEMGIPAQRQSAFLSALLLEAIFAAADSGVVDERRRFSDLRLSGEAAHGLYSSRRMGRFKAHIESQQRIHEILAKVEHTAA